VIGHPSGNLLSLALGVRPAPPFFLPNHSTRSSACDILLFYLFTISLIAISECNLLAFATMVEELCTLTLDLA